MTSPIAAIDCGTNTIKLLVATPTAGGLEVHHREARMVRLGERVDRTGRLSDAALERTFAAVDEYAELIRARDVDRLRFCATSATRDASNGASFVEGIRSRLGVEPEVLSGDQEAALAYAGAVHHLEADPVGLSLVVDVGGGSTELILGRGPEVVSVHSMDIGSVRLHERHLYGDPPSAGQIAACIADIDASLDATPLAPSEAATVIGVAGTVTTVAAAALGLASYDRTRIDQQVVAVADVHRVVDELMAMPVATRRDLGFMHPGRADVIGAGGLILSRVLHRAGVETLLVSESDILEGIALSLTT